MDKVENHATFSNLCKTCERVSKMQKKDEKRKEIKDYIDFWREFHAKLHEDNPNSDDTFFPAMRLLLPQLERERGAYGIKETTLAKMYIEILVLARDGDVAQKLLNYRAPNTANAEAGDFASVAELVLKNRCRAKGFLKVSNINQHLDNISISNADKNREEVKRNLKFLLDNTTAQEQKWLIRMILKDMKMGVSEQTILNLFHPDAKDLFDVTSSLAKVCSQLSDPTIRLHEIEISLFTPFRPMLAARAKLNEVEKTMNNEPFLIDTKLDGERVQLHKDGNSYKYYSRSGLEYTHMYGPSPLEGSFTPYIGKLFRKDVSSCILDGEMVGWNKTLDCIGTKGQNFDVKTLVADDPDYQPCFFVFDILLYNGTVLSNLPLNKRLEHLNGLFVPLEGRFMSTPQRTSSTKQDVIDALNEAIDSREEGIILKNPSSVYKPNSRGWLKVKPDYIDNLMNEMDLIILGGYYGEGRRSKLVSHFLLGVAVEEGGDPKEFHSFAKVGSGYSLQELQHLLNRLEDNWHKYDKKKPPLKITLAQGHKEKPDLWIDPTKSTILQVKAAEIINSGRFKTGCTLRFPRVEKVRSDKNWNECLTLKELEELRKETQGKLVSRHMDEDEDSTSPKKRRLTNRAETSRSVAPQFRPTDVSDVAMVSDSFKGKEVCIISGPDSHSKSSLEKIVTKLGGTFVQNPGENTYCIITEKLNQRARNLLQSERYDVIKPDWLLRCNDAEHLVQWTPFDFWYITPQTNKSLSVYFDKFGDSYTEDLTQETLKLVFNRVTKEDIENVDMDITRIAELEYEYFPNSSPLGLFRIYRFYIDNKETISDVSTKMSNHFTRIAELQLQYYGAVVNDELDDDTTHVLVHQKDYSRLDELKMINKARVNLFHIITEKWVSSCISSNCIETERFFYPVFN